MFCEYSMNSFHGQIYRHHSFHILEFITSQLSWEIMTMTTEVTMVGESPMCLPQSPPSAASRVSKGWETGYTAVGDMSQEAEARARSGSRLKLF